MSLIRPPCSETTAVHDRTEPTVPQTARARGDGMADTYHDEVIIKVRANLDSTMVTRTVHGQPHRELNGSNAAKSARGVYRINSVSCSLG